MWQDALLFVLYLNTNVLLQPQSEATLSSGEVGVVPKEMSSSYPASFWTLFFLCWTSKNSRHAVRAQLLQSFPTLGNCMDCSLPGSSIHGIFLARILEWVAIPFSRGSSWPRDWTQDSCIAVRFFTNWYTREALVNLKTGRWKRGSYETGLFFWGAKGHFPLGRKCWIIFCRPEHPLLSLLIVLHPS